MKTSSFQSLGCIVFETLELDPFFNGLCACSRSFSKEDNQVIPRSSTSGNKSIHRGNSQSSALVEGAEPQEDAKSFKSYHRGSSLNSAFLAEVAESQEDGRSSRGENTPKDPWHLLDSSNLGSP